MHYVPSYQAVPFKLRVQKALRQIIFLFVPIGLLVALWYIRATTSEAYRPAAGETLFMAGVIGVPIGLVLWFVYRLVRFTIGR